MMRTWSPTSVGFLVSVLGALALAQPLPYNASNAASPEQERTIDLFVAVTLPLDAALLPDLASSIDLFWKGRINGKVILLCVDCHFEDESQAWEAERGMEETMAATFSWLTRGYEVHNGTAPKCLHPYVGHQWANFEAARLSTADYIAFMDSDGIFHVPVAEHLLFDGSGRTNIIARPGKEATRWTPAIQKLLAVAPGTLPEIDFMASLPFVFRRDTLLRLREHVEQAVHTSTKGAVNSWEGAWCHHFAHIQTLGEMPCDFCLMGSYALLHEPHRYNFAVEGKSTPVMRLVSHQGVDWKPRTCAIQACDPALPCASDVKDSSRKLSLLGDRSQEEKGDLRNAYFGTKDSRPVELKGVSGPLAQVACFHENRRSAECTRHKCTDVLHPLLNWEQRSCWARDGSAASQRPGVDSYFEALGMSDALTACESAAVLTAKALGVKDRAPPSDEEVDAVKAAADALNDATKKAGQALDAAAKAANAAAEAVGAAVKKAEAIGRLRQRKQANVEGKGTSTTKELRGDDDEPVVHRRPQFGRDDMPLQARLAAEATHEQLAADEAAGLTGCSCSQVFKVRDLVLQALTTAH